MYVYNCDITKLLCVTVIPVYNLNPHYMRRPISHSLTNSVLNFSMFDSLGKWYYIIVLIRIFIMNESLGFFHGLWIIHVRSTHFSDWSSSLNRFLEVLCILVKLLKEFFIFLYFEASS